MYMYIYMYSVFIYIYIYILFIFMINAHISKVYAYRIYLIAGSSAARHRDACRFWLWQGARRKTFQGPGRVVFWDDISSRWCQLSSVQNLCWLMIVEDYATQHFRDYNNPIEGFLKTNQYNGMREGFWTLLSTNVNVQGIFVWIICPLSSILGS